MSDEPTTEQVTRALADSLLLEELADAVGQRPTQH